MELLEKLSGESFADWLNPHWRAQGSGAPVRRGRQRRPGVVPTPSRQPAAAGVAGDADETVVAGAVKGTLVADAPVITADQETPVASD